MKLLILIAGLAPTVIFTQSVADLPGCSLDCFASAISLTTCGATDYVCQCQSQNSVQIRKSVSGCLTGSTCTLTDLQKVSSWSDTFCKQVLSSASAPSPTSTTPASTSSESTVAAPSATDSFNATHFGAGTPGTNWGTLKETHSNANRAPALEAVSIILLSIAAMILALRIFTRLYTQHMRQAVKGVWWDEWFALATLVGTAGITASIVVGANHGMGRHLPADTTIEQLVALIQIVYAFIIIVTFAFGTLKMSILFVYLRMTPHKSHKITIYVMMGLVIAHNIPATLGQVFSCTPIHEYWNLGYPIFKNPHCIDILAFDHFNNAWSVLEDIVIWILPVPTVWSLRIPFKRKASLYGLLAFSLISVLCAILRMSFVVLWVRSDDIAWDYILIPFLANMECCVALMTTSAPGILPFLRTGNSPPPPRRPQPQIEIEKASSVQPSEPSEKELESQDSTAVPATADQSDRSSRTWSLLSKLRPSTAMSKRHSGFMDPNRHLTTCKSETGMSGPRTELKEFGDEEEVVPGVRTEPQLRVK